MKVTKRMINELPIDRKENILNKISIFEETLLKNKSLSNIQKGFWIRNIKGTDVYKFRVNSGDRILFKYIDNEIYFISYCKHDDQVRVARNYKNGSQLLDFKIDKSVYIEENIDFEIDKSIINETYAKLSEIKRELVIDDEYISISIDEGNKEDMNLLSEEQFECLSNQSYSSLILGCAGSGKTMIAIRKLLMNNELNLESVYISSSKKIIERTKEFYYTFNNNFKNVKFYNYKDLCKKILNFENKTIIDYEDFKLWLTQYTRLLKCINNIDIKKVWIEIRTNIKGNGYLLNLNEYLYNCKSSYNLDERKVFYKISCEYNNWLKRNGYYDDNDLAIMAIDKIGNKKYDFVIFDEVQELTKIQSKLILKLSKDMKNTMFLGDLNQNINIEKFNKNFIKEILFENNLNLKEFYINKNYRSSRGIINWINKFNEIRNSKFKSIGAIYEEKEKVFKDGNKPKIVSNLKYEKELFEKVNDDADSIIVVYENEDKEELRKIGYSIGRVFSIEEVRGLEYENIYCYNIVYRLKDLWEEIFKGNLKVNEVNKIYFNAIYIAVTRGKKNVCFIEHGETILINYLNKYLDEVKNENELFLEIQGTVELNKWIIEAKKLEKSENYYQAAEAYKKAGRFKDADICLEALERKLSYENNEENSRYIIIELDNNELIKENILNILNELNIKNKVLMQGYVDIFTYYTNGYGFRKEEIYIYDGKNLNEICEKIYQILNKNIVNKKKFIIKTCFYNNGKVIVGKESKEDMLIKFHNNSIEIKARRCEKIRNIDKLLDNNNKLNTISDRIRYENKYRDMDSDDILKFIFNK